MTVSAPRPGWQDRAACVHADPDLFYTEVASRVVLAKAVCDGCPVIVQCGQHGVLHEPDGVWGGMSADERAQRRAQLGIVVSTPGQRPYAAQVRQERIRGLAADGLAVPEIAERAGVTTREVHRVLARDAA